METFTSDWSGRKFPLSEKVSAQELRPSILEMIRGQQPAFDENCQLALSELSLLRQQYISGLLDKDLAELNELESMVVEAIEDQHRSIVGELEENVMSTTLGQRVADKVADFGGSWAFIIGFGVFIIVWIGINAFWLANSAFDPYPFILLNLLLSCLAAMQAPIIMMSQNRQEEKDRDRAKKDYLINLKSELEIRLLHEKMDHLIKHQQQELLEIQRVQVELMEDILKFIKPDASK